MYLIIGASGFIGKYLYSYCLENDIDVLGTYCTHQDNFEWIKFDICKDELTDICNHYMYGKIPSAMIICGANGSIDNCKKNENASNQLNVVGTKRILKQAQRLGIKCVFLSSEAVFDGKTGMYSEEDVPNPITLYGSQKLQIEQYIMCNHGNYLIFRISRAVSWQFGEKDIFNEFYQKIVSNKEILCLKNQSFCLTDVHDIAVGIIKSLEKGISGLYHLSSNNYISRYELAQIYAKKMVGSYEKIVENEYSKLSFYDKRHIYGGLNGDKLKRLIEINYKTIPEILNLYIQSLKAESKLLQL